MKKSWTRPARSWWRPSSHRTTALRMWTGNGPGRFEIIASGLGFRLGYSGTDGRRKNNRSELRRPTRVVSHGGVSARAGIQCAGAAGGIGVEVGTECLGAGATVVGAALVHDLSVC